MSYNDLNEVNIVVVMGLCIHSSFPFNLSKSFSVYRIYLTDGEKISIKCRAMIAQGDTETVKCCIDPGIN